MKFLTFFLLFCSFLKAQNTYPKEYFDSPLEIPLQISGNFGELRSNHFHTGLDFRTQQKEGLKVLAAAEGYVSRIKISSFGSGKTIYINHPNGFTTVYYHLQRAVENIERYIKNAHYREKSFEIDLFLEPHELVVKKGQQIAISGNTGSSGGPHLHFEIRDTKTEEAINPLFFGFDKWIKDTKKPLFSGLYVYPLDEKTMANETQKPSMLNVFVQKDGSYISERVKANGKIGFGIIANDFDDTSTGKKGVFKISTFINGTLDFSCEFNSISFNDLRYINAFIDYEHYQKTKQRIEKLFMKKPYDLKNIKTNETNGVITTTPNLSSIYAIEMLDFYGNKTEVLVPIQYDLLPEIIENTSAKCDYFVKSNKDNLFTKEKWSVYIPENTFYEDFDLIFEIKDKTLILNDDVIPAHTNFTISVEDVSFTPAEREKVFLGRIEDKKIVYKHTFYKENAFNAKTKTLGKYKLVSDLVSPEIAIIKPIEGKTIVDSKVEFIIHDALSGIKSYNGYINGKWILMEYDYKTQKLTHYFNDGIVAEGENELKLIVVDNVGNSATFETRFFKY